MADWPSEARPISRPDHSVGCRYRREDFAIVRYVHAGGCGSVSMAIVGARRSPVSDVRRLETYPIKGRRPLRHPFRPHLGTSSLRIMSLGEALFGLRYSKSKARTRCATLRGHCATILCHSSSRVQVAFAEITTDKRLTSPGSSHRSVGANRISRPVP
jgi:hypothetical protein